MTMSNITLYCRNADRTIALDFTKIFVSMMEPSSFLIILVPSTIQRCELNEP
jgi:hypothetical protein